MTGVIWTWELAPTVCSCHMERVPWPPGADTRTMDAHSDTEDCTTGAPLKPFGFSGSQINTLFAWESPGGVEGENGCSHIQCMTRLELNAERIKSQFRRREQSLLCTFLIRWQEPSGKAASSQGVGALSLSFNPERQDVRAAVWESSWLHQGVVRRRRLEAGPRESRRQVTLFCHTPGTTAFTSLFAIAQVWRYSFP